MEKWRRDNRTEVVITDMDACILSVMPIESVGKANRQALVETCRFLSWSE